MTESTFEPSGDTYSEAETIARREAALQRMFATPHTPHKPKGKADERKRGKGSDR